MAISCDGCQRAFPSHELTYVQDYGHEVRYCEGCRDTYLAFVDACHAEEARRQRELDLWMLTTRANLPLLLTPMDLPPMKHCQRVPLGEKPLVLG